MRLFSSFLPFPLIVLGGPVFVFDGGLSVGCLSDAPLSPLAATQWSPHIGCSGFSTWCDGVFILDCLGGLHPSLSPTLQTTVPVRRPKVLVSRWRLSEFCDSYTPSVSPASARTAQTVCQSRPSRCQTRRQRLGQRPTGTTTETHSLGVFSP